MSCWCRKFSSCVAGSTLLQATSMHWLTRWRPWGWCAFACTASFPPRFCNSLRRYHTNPYDTLPSFRQFFGQNSGTCIFSRHPIRASRSVVFDSHETLTNKGFTAACVAVQSATILFVSTHFDSRDPDSKRAQWQQLGDALSPHLAHVSAAAVLALPFCALRLRCITHRHPCRISAQNISPDVHTWLSAATSTRAPKQTNAT